MRTKMIVSNGKSKHCFVPWIIYSSVYTQIRDTNDIFLKQEVFFRKMRIWWERFHLFTVYLVWIFYIEANSDVSPILSYRFLYSECQQMVYHDANGLMNFSSPISRQCCPNSIGVQEGSNMTSNKPISATFSKLTDSIVFNIWIKPRLLLNDNLVVISVPSSKASCRDSFQVRLPILCISV